MIEANAEPKTFVGKLQTERFVPVEIIREEGFSLDEIRRFVFQRFLFQRLSSSQEAKVLSLPLSPSLSLSLSPSPSLSFSKSRKLKLEIKKPGFVCLTRIEAILALAGVGTGFGLSLRARAFRAHAN